METREIDQEVAEQIMQGRSCVFDEELTSVYRESYSVAMSNWEVYRVGDGGILAVTRIGTHAYRPDGTMVPYPNPEQIDLARFWSTQEEFWADDETKRELREEAAKMEAAMAARDAENLRRLRETISDGNGFIAAAPFLAKQLPQRLDIDPPRLDGTPGSMKWVDEAVRSLGGKRCFEPDIFLPLAAYVGEVIRLATEGQWLLTEAAFYPIEQEVLMPCILSGQRVCHHVAENLMNDLMDHLRLEDDADFDSRINISQHVEDAIRPSTWVVNDPNLFRL